uniref:DUF4283 domain-containing protein n=1 Tax=Cannabis sativa TaxID=3483 RepID=A0A803QR69_CANSA
MAKTRAKLYGKVSAEANKPKKTKKKGPTSTTDVRKMKTLEEVLGVEALEFSEEEDDAPEEVQADFEYFLTANRKCSTSIAQGNITTLPVLRTGTIVRNQENSFKNSEHENRPKVTITLQDIEDEVEFLKSLLVCYVFGANPPLSVLDGIVRKVCKGEVERVEKSNQEQKGAADSLVDADGFQQVLKGRKEKGKEVFAALATSNTFQSLLKQEGTSYCDGEMADIKVQSAVKDLILRQKIGLVGLLETRVKAQKLWALYLSMFKGWCFTSNIAWHKRGRIIVAWNPNSFNVSILKSISQLIHLHVSTVGQLGNPLQVDPATKERNKLNFPRVLIEVSIHQDFPANISFEDEYGANVNLSITYEWKPLICAHCKGLGHATTDCRKKEGKTQQWVVKEKSNQEQKGAADTLVVADGFQQVLKGRKEKGKEVFAAVATSNTFHSLLKILSWNVRGINDQHKQSAVKDLILRQKSVFVGLLETKVKAQKLVALYLSMFKDGKYKFYATFLYAFNEDGGRIELWNELQQLVTKEEWVLLGDFNEILHKEERVGKKVKYKATTEFANCIEICHLEDLKASGNFYRWCNKRQDDERIYSKIDRVLVNEAWLDKLANSEVVFLTEGAFDHTQIVLTIYPEVLSGKKPFKDFKMWATHSQFPGILVKGELKGLNREAFSDIVAREAGMKHLLAEYQEGLQKDPFNEELQHKVKETTKAYIKTQNEIIKERRRQNRILSIETKEGIRCEDAEKVTEAFLDYYKSLLGGKMSNRRKVQRIVMAQGPLVTDEQAVMLLREFTKEEVREALFGILESRHLAQMLTQATFFRRTGIC